MGWVLIVSKGSSYASAMAAPLTVTNVPPDLTHATNPSAPALGRLGWVTKITCTHADAYTHTRTQTHAHAHAHIHTRTHRNTNKAALPPTHNPVLFLLYNELISN